MIAAYVEDGDLRVEVGKNRKTNLGSGESVYFDGNLGYIFTNTGSKPAKIFLATYPAIVFLKKPRDPVILHFAAYNQSQY